MISEANSNQRRNALGVHWGHPRAPKTYPNFCVKVKLSHSEYKDHIFWKSGTNQIKGMGGGGEYLFGPLAVFRDVQFPILMAYISVVHPYGLYL